MGKSKKPSSPPQLTNIFATIKPPDPKIEVMEKWDNAIQQLKAIPKPRKPGAGRPSFFTADEVDRARKGYRRLLAENPKINDVTAVTRLAPLVPPEKRGAEDYLRNWQRYVFVPERGKRGTTK